MRKDWEYKKLGEMCDIYQPKTISTDSLYEKGKYPVYGANGIIGRYNEYNHEATEILLTCRGATCGRINISVPYSWINGNAMVIHRKSDALHFDFLKYSMMNIDYSLIITGAAQPQITRQKLAPTIIPIPPKPTQLAIVAELDKINELIQLKKQQLKDYDQLAQSIFYEMFGDPVENEKGWEVKKLGDLCTIFAGGDKPNDTRQFLDEEYKYPVIANGDGNKGVLGYTKNCKVKEDAVTIGARGASIGNCRIVKNGFTPAVRLLTLIPGAFLNCSYLFYIVKGLDYKQNGAGQAQLTVPNIKIETVPLPPLPLQQQFAARIEAIERQKQQVSETIKDLETLLASRMQYWFD